MATMTELEKKIARLEKELSDLRARFLDETYVLNEWERSEVRRGLSDSLATDKEVQAVFKKYGVSFAL